MSALRPESVLGLRYWVRGFHVLTARFGDYYPLTQPSPTEGRGHKCGPRGAVETPAVLVKALLRRETASGASQRCNVSDLVDRC